MAKAAKKTKRAVKAKAKRKPAKRTARSPHLAESRRSRSKAQAFANQGCCTDPDLARLSAGLADTRKVVSGLAGSIGESLPKIHAAVQQLVLDHGNFRRAAGNHVGQLFGQVRGLLEFAEKATLVFEQQSRHIEALASRVQAIETLLRS